MGQWIFLFSVRKIWYTEKQNNGKDGIAMRVVHTSDWHIGKVLNDYSLLEDQA